MSNAWARGSTPQWRRLRTRVLERDKWICQLCHTPIPRHLRPPHPDSATVHHVLGRAVSGDDERYLVAAHRKCNAAVGEPKHSSPEHRPVTRW